MSKAERRRSFYVGGSYVESDGEQIMQGQMYVEEIKPAQIMHPYPLVLIHGGAQTAMNWITTPDGRAGWAEWFVAQGWTVYLVDQPTRGRSAWQSGVDGAATPATVSFIEKMFTAPEYHKAWPQAELHTQWPGGPDKGRAGDPVFDQFYASQVPSVSRKESEQRVPAAIASLLDEIGPAILVAHSQAGLFTWLVADARPDLVKAIVSMEPSGPPVSDLLSNGTVNRPFGLSSEPLTYDPPVTPDSPLQFVQQENSSGPNLARCWSQAGEPRRLSNLTSIPVLLVTGEASYHAVFDHCTARYLEQAGVACTFVRLEDQGIRGNGHMLMLENNHLEIAALIGKWLISYESTISLETI